MSKFDFKGALGWFNLNCIKDYRGEKFETIAGVPILTILTALRIADRLQRGEVSDAAQDAFNDEDIYHVEFCVDDYFITNSPRDFKKAFKAMATQMIKEIEDE